jgi:hypothetical protein
MRCFDFAAMTSACTFASATRLGSGVGGAGGTAPGIGGIGARFVE